MYHTCPPNSFNCSIICCFNPFPNKPWFLRVCSTNLLKTQWEEEKLLVTSNFSFSHSVFCPFGTLSTIFIKYEIVVCKLFQFGQSEIMSFGKGLIHCLPITTQYCIFTHLAYIAVENTVRKGEIAYNKQFLLFSQCFLPYMVLLSILNAF